MGRGLEVGVAVCAGVAVAFEVGVAVGPGVTAIVASVVLGMEFESLSPEHPERIATMVTRMLARTISCGRILDLLMMPPGNEK